MLFNRVCFMFEVPVLKSYYDRYDMDLLRKNGLEIIVYDFSPILHPTMAKPLKTNSMECVEEVKLRRIDSIKNLKKYRNELKNAFVWTTFPVYDKSYNILREISEYHYGFICNIDYVPRVSRLIRAQSCSFWLNWTPSRIRNAVLSRIPHQYLPVKKADVMITYAEDRVEDNLKNIFWNKKTKVVLANTLDYNECLKKEKNEKGRLVDERYILFIDQYIPYHADGTERRFGIEPEKYYAEINHFLDEVSSILKLEVVVAAHPKAKYDEHPNCYPNKEIIQFHTCELVRDAELVISHSSISLSYVDIFMKPSIIVSTSEMERNDIIHAGLITVASEMGKEVVNVTKINQRKEIERIVNSELGKPAEIYKNHAKKYRLAEGTKNSDCLFGEVLLSVMQDIKE